jgi:hypothetical protein
MRENQITTNTQKMFFLMNGFYFINLMNQFSIEYPLIVIFWQK